jgi:uncharacterized YccA/Bax inhibitor family protein
MAIKNPVFSRIDAEQKQGQFATFRTGPAAAPAPSTIGDLEQSYAGPPATTADTGRLTYDDVIMKTAAQFIVLLAGAALSWRYVSGLSVDHQSRGIAVWLAAMFVGLGLGLAISFMRTISVPLILTYAAVEGLFVGAASEYFNTAYPGVVGQAVIGTLGAFAGMLLAYKTGVIKVTDKFRRIMSFAIAGYACVALVSLVFAFLGTGNGFGFYGVGPLGVLLCGVGVAFAAVSLALNFDTIDRMVAAGAPAKTSWLLGHGLLVTLVWLYIELLRLLSVLRNN